MEPLFPSTASRVMLQFRAQLLRATRAFFDSRGFIEVDTPLLSHDRVIDPHLEPFACLPAERLDIGANRAEPSRGARSIRPLYLQTSPEFAMKRLLAAGMPAIYQLGKVFRARERGSRHNPEFTMLEWYQSGDTHWGAMHLTEALVRELHRVAVESAMISATLPGLLSTSFPVTTYAQAFERVYGVAVHSLNGLALRELCDRHEISVPAGISHDDRDTLLNLLLAEKIEPTLGASQPEFLVDYPPTQAALAKVRAEDPPVAERFELYWQGLELCNGYHELTDPVELRRRIEIESQRRAQDGLPPLPVENRLLEAMERGLPDCAGNALGFDRLMMRLVGATRIDDVIPFPVERA